MCRGIEREQQKERDPKVSVNGTEGGFDALRTHDEEAGFSACVVAALVFTLSQGSCVSSTVFCGRVCESEFERGKRSGMLSF